MLFLLGKGGVGQRGAAVSFGRFASTCPAVTVTCATHSHADDVIRYKTITRQTYRSAESVAERHELEFPFGEENSGEVNTCGTLRLVGGMTCARALAIKRIYTFEGVMLTITGLSLLYGWFLITHAQEQVNRVLTGVAAGEDEDEDEEEKVRPHWSKDAILKFTDKADKLAERRLERASQTSSGNADADTAESTV